MVAQARVMRNDQLWGCIWNTELIEIANGLEWEMKEKRKESIMGNSVWFCRINHIHRDAKG